MNDSAAVALRWGTEALLGGVELDDDLREIVARGLTVREGAVLFATFVARNPIKTGGVARAIDRMGWRNLTMYECQHNSFHLEDDSMRGSELNEDGVPRISEADQVTLMRRGLLLARYVSDFACSLAAPVPVRCIVSADETNGTFCFHQIRDGEQWHTSDLDRYEIEKVVVLDSRQ